MIVGAGISGIDAAYHVQTRCPGRSYVILEGRERMGGTWDLFRYPGIRSDSDMYTLGFPFRPWTHEQSIAGGDTILAYVKETAELYGIDRKIRYRKRVERARWSSETSRWTLDIRDGDRVEHLTCNFLHLCVGYYDYDHGYTPELPGRERFRGTVIHPQQWPEDLDYANQRIVVIGSGATAMTLVPELAKRAAHVTMLQRSPTYVMSVPARDRIAARMRAVLSPRRAYAVTRWKNVLLGMAFYQWCRRFPAHAKRVLVNQVRKQLGDDAVAQHFTPAYNPWDQRLCLVPDADLFVALRDGRAAVVTGEIETFVEDGIRLRSGTTLPADIVVTATGLVLRCFGKIELHVDGARVDPATTMVYRGMMCSGVPNLAFSTGYTNASWTLKCDLTSRFVCRVMNHMDAHGFTRCMPQRDPAMPELPLLDFTSGYVQRGIAQFPRQGTALPWRLYQNYALDLVMLEHGRIDDGILEFARSSVATRDLRGASKEHVGP